MLAIFASSCHLVPLWEGKVEVRALERKSIAACGTGALTPEGAKRVTRSPYIQSTTTTSTNVVWGSIDGKAAVVLSEPSKGEVVQTVPAVYAADPGRAAARLAAQVVPGKELAADNILVVKSELVGLKPTHLYCYQIVADDGPLTELAPLTTAAAPGLDQPTHFVMVGDTGTGGAAQVAIAKRMSEVPFDLMVFLGDIAYESGTPTQLETRFFQIYRDYLRYVPAYPAIGNHERRTRQGRPYFEAFVLPEPERYYSFDWGDVHFVAIDTTQRDTKQLQWLTDDLGKNKLPWVIVYGHHPMYTNALRGPQRGIRRAFAKILTDHKVDLVIMGHEHHYERFRVGGVNYIVSGGGGGQLTRFFGSFGSLKKATVHHYLAFEVTAKTLVMKAINIGGKEIEELKLTKDGEGPIKVKVDDKPETKSTPVAPEKQTTPDETLHDKPDDDDEKEKLTPPTGVPEKMPVPTPTTTPPKKAP